MGRNNFSILINEENIISNYNYIKNLSKKEIISVIKSNAYSHGTKESIIALSKAGCKYFAVAREEEVMEILNLGLDLKNITILVFETLSNLNLLKEHNNV
uniref:alanine racemase n=1 Tax=uncultured Cetobacterium sp. TaxID=527638 RepID=UPI00260EF27B